MSGADDDGGNTDEVLDSQIRWLEKVAAKKEERAAIVADLRARASMLEQEAAAALLSAASHYEAGGHVPAPGRAKART